MGKNLHPTIMPFIISRMKFHQDVIEVEDISTEEHYIFRIKRRKGLRDVIVLVNDCYHFGEFDYFSKPAELNDGGFILIARPESSFFQDLIEYIEDDKVIIGKIGILLGALRIDEYWTYQRPKEEKTNK